MEYVKKNFYNVSLVSKYYNYLLSSNDKYLCELTKHIEKNILLFHELDEEVKYLIADRLSNILTWNILTNIFEKLDRIITFVRTTKYLLVCYQRLIEQS